MGWGLPLESVGLGLDPDGTLIAFTVDDSASLSCAKDAKINLEISVRKK